MGGGGRYLSILAGPLSLIFLLIWFPRNWRETAAQAVGFATPFLPLLLACLLVVVIHPSATIGDPFSRVFWASFIFLAAARLSLPRTAVYSAAAIGASVYCLVAIRDVFFLGAVRAGNDVNEIVFAETAMLTGGIAIVGALTSKGSSPALRILWSLLGGAGLCAVALSGSRGPLLATFLLGGFAIAHGWRQGHHKAIVATILTLGVAVGVALLYAPLADRIVLAGTQTQEYFSASSPTLTSIGIRLELWRITLESLPQQPVFGYGYSTVGDLATRLPSLKFLPPEILYSFQHFHADWAHALMAGGLVLLIGLSASIVLLARTARHDMARLWLLSAMVVFGLTDLAFFRKPTLTLFIAAWALLVASSQRTDHVT